MPRIQIRDVSLPVDVIGDGHPLVLMHGGPGADHLTLVRPTPCGVSSGWSLRPSL